MQLPCMHLLLQKLCESSSKINASKNPLQWELPCNGNIAASILKHSIFAPLISNGTIGLIPNEQL